MTIEEYFGGWMRVLPLAETKRLREILRGIYAKRKCTPAFQNIFRAFHITPYDKLCAVIIGQDVYPQKGVATGIAFGNKKGTLRLSPSLELIKEAVINYEIPHNFYTFDESLESWGEQGILMLNAALTCETGKPLSHSMMWYAFMRDFLKKLDESNPGLVYILFGRQAQSFESFIPDGIVLKSEHPSFLIRNNRKINAELFPKFVKLIEKNFGRKIKLYDEEKWDSQE